MNKNIKQLIEDYMAFDPAVLTNGRRRSKLSTDIVGDILTAYTPKNEIELKDIIKQLYNKGCTDFNCIDISNITNLSNAFKGLNIKEIDISFWNMDNVMHCSGMFQGCKKLTHIYMPEWDVSRILDMDSMFSGCKSLESVEGLDDWNVNDNCPVRDMFHNVPYDIIPDWFKNIGYPVVDIDAVCEFNDVSDINQLESISPKKLRNADGTYTLWFSWYAYLIKNSPQSKYDLLTAFRLAPTSYGTIFSQLNKDNIMTSDRKAWYPQKIKDWNIKGKIYPWQ